MAKSAGHRPDRRPRQRARITSFDLVELYPLADTDGLSALMAAAFSQM